MSSDAESQQDNQSSQDQAQSTEAPKTSKSQDKKKGGSQSHASKKKDYKNIIITDLLKMLKKQKAFAIRKWLRNVKEIEEGRENRAELRESKEEYIRRADAVKALKNPQMRSVVPLLIRLELHEELDKYWPVLESMVNFRLSRA